MKFIIIKSPRNNFQAQKKTTFFGGFHKENASLRRNAGESLFKFSILFRQITGASLSKFWKALSTQSMPLHMKWGKIANKGFWPLPPLKWFCKNYVKFRIDSEWPETARNRNFFLPLCDPPPEKNFEKFSKIFLKIFWKLFRIIWNVKKTRNFFFHFFSVIPKKNLEKFSNFFFENFSKVVQNHLKREKNSKKKFFIFSLFWVRLGESTPKVLGILNH